MDPESEEWVFSNYCIWFGALNIGVLEVYIVGWDKCVQWCVKGVVGMCSAVLPTGDYHSCKWLLSV